MLPYIVKMLFFLFPDKVPVYKGILDTGYVSVKETGLHIIFQIRELLQDFGRKAGVRICIELAHILYPGQGY